MSRLLCCLRVRRPDMGAALSHPQEGEACDAGVPVSPPTMADVIRERKKKAGGAGLGTLRRRLAAAARRPRDARPDRGCEHARFIRGVVSRWRLGEVFLLREELEAGAALRDLATQAELAREPAPALHADLLRLYAERWACDVDLLGKGFALPAHRLVLQARCSYFRDLLLRYPNSCRVPLEGVGGSLSREELEAAVLVLYGGSAALRGPAGGRCAVCCKWDRGSEADLDIISVENSTLQRCTCRGRRMEPGRLRRVAETLGFAPDGLHRDMKYLLDSGELCDARLSWSVDGEGADGECEGDAEGDGGAYGFRSAMELPCHRLLLAARSRFFRSMMSRRGACSGTVCVDERVLPRRFARALLHAAYTDQVDLSLVSRSGPGTSSGTGSCRSGRPSPEDAFRLYELSLFLEMPIAAQGCEDALVRALAPDTLPAVLRWSGAKHASPWVHRQAMRYLRDEFPSIMSHPGSARIPRAALAAALASPFLQASEAQALRAVIRWAERAAPPPCSEPNVVWHTRRDGRSRRRRRGPADEALREAAAALIPLLRLEHLPPDCDLLQQAVRRGLAVAPGTAGAEAWLAHRPPRCFLPYLDEIKALLEDQEVPEAELARARRQRYAHRIPDTLYMVTSHRARHDPEASSPRTASCAPWCVPPRVLREMRGRLRELRAAPPALRALALHAADAAPVTRQLALRAVRERSLPDCVAELLVNDDDDDREGGAPATARGDVDEDCCRSNSGSLRCGSAATHASIESSRPGTYRRELPARPVEALHRAAPCPAARLSLAVPDVAMAPNANTHLLTARDYPHYPRGGRAPHHELGVLQLDLGDGAAHAPRHGSRAQRQAVDARRRETQGEHDELRAAIELSVIRAYSSLQAARRSGASGAEFSTGRPRAAPSPSLGAAGHERRRDRPPPPRAMPPAGRSPSPRRSPATYGQRDYRAEGAYNRSPRSRGHSPAYT